MPKAYFISDLHLGAVYDSDSRQRERLVVEFLNEIRSDASELYLVGDILDYWFEYRTVVPRGHVRFFGALASLADAGVKITWLIGNHDIWLFDYLRNEIGLEVVDGVLERDILGSRFLITHGDGVGRKKRSFRFIRGLFRNRLCQKLYSGLHPRWTVPFALRWSSHSRRHDAPPEKAIAAAISSLRDYSRERLAADPSLRYFVFGHLHRMIDEKIIVKLPTPGGATTIDASSVTSTGATPSEAKAQFVMLGDWLTHFSYGVFDGSKFELRRFKSISKN